MKTQSHLQAKLAKHMPEIKEIDYSHYILSPMPGKVVSVAVKAGDKVNLHQPLVVVEAMKMQNVLRSPKDGIIKKVICKPGENVAVDAILIEFEQ